MKRTNSRIFSLLLLTGVFIVSGLLAGCTPKRNSVELATPDEANELMQAQLRDELDENVKLPPTTEYSYVAEFDGQTALDLLEKNAEVQTKSYDFGSFIEGIDGIMGTEKEYWAFYVNREMAQQAADKTILKKGDSATFRLEPVESFPVTTTEPK